MPLLLPLPPVPLLPALQVLTREILHQEKLLQPQQTPAAGPASLIGRCYPGTDEDKVIGLKVKSPMTLQTKDDMTAWVITEIVHGIHLVPGIRMLHPRHQEILVNGARLILQGLMELEPAWSRAHLNPHSEKGSPSANPGPLSPKL